MKGTFVKVFIKNSFVPNIKGILTKNLGFICGNKFVYKIRNVFKRMIEIIRDKFQAFIKVVFYQFEGCVLTLNKILRLTSFGLIKNLNKMCQIIRDKLQFFKKVVFYNFEECGLALNKILRRGINSKFSPSKLMNVKNQIIKSLKLILFGEEYLNYILSLESEETNKNLMIYPNFRDFKEEERMGWKLEKNCQIHNSLEGLKF